MTDMCRHTLCLPLKTGGAVCPHFFRTVLAAQGERVGAAAARALLAHCLLLLLLSSPSLGGVGKFGSRFSVKGKRDEYASLFLGDTPPAYSDIMWEVEYAKSGRAKCKGCYEAIANKTCRVGKIMDGEWGPYTAWYHSECAPWTSIPSVNYLDGYNRMRADDKKKLKDLCQGRGRPRMLGSGGASSSSSASAVALAPGRAWMPLPAHGSPGIDWDTINDETREETDVLYCSLDLMVVGCRYYSGMLYRGEMSDLVREPNNLYDPNAIRCDNIHGTQVGHIKREQAACLARILDDTSPLTPYVDVTVEKAGMSQFSVPVVARVYGPPQYKVQVTNYLAANGMRMRGDGTGAGGSQQVPTVVSSRRIVNSVETQKQLDGLYSKLQEDMEKLDITGVEEALKDSLLSPLYLHQKQGIAWMIKREKDESMPPFWTQVSENGGTAYFNDITKSSQSKAPMPVKGGIVADDMGLGKTLQTLSVVAAHAPPDPLLNRRVTLIVCPTSVISNWVDQAALHFVEGRIRTFVYHGAGRDASLFQAENSRPGDVVITTYATLTQELGPNSPQKKRKHAGGDVASCVGLLDTPWLRVVLDEAHTVRNNKTKAHSAVCKLDSTFRWCLTGTPLQNKAEDIQSLLAFQRAAPLDDPKIFSRAISRPIRDGDPEGVQKLRVLLRAVCMRRTKDLLVSTLPLRTIEVHRLQMQGAEKEAYDALYSSTRCIFQGLMAGGESELLSNYASVLECLLRLRQVCDAISLVPVERLERARQVVREIQLQEVAAKKKRGRKKASIEPMSAAEALKLLDKLKGALEGGGEGGGGDDGKGNEAVFECAVCLSDLEAAKARILRGCSHCFCDFCLDRLVKMSSRGSERCPLCRASFDVCDILEARQLQDALAKEEAAADAEGVKEEGGSGGEMVVAEEQRGPLRPLPRDERPLKCKALIESLRQNWAEDAEQKAVVFSQFTTMLDIVEAVLNEEGIPCTRIDGSMSLKKRQMAISEFSRLDGGPVVLLVSLKSGGQGINLARGNLVYMMDLWWNAAAESQAQDRVYRIGQVRPVKVVRYLMQGTIEERLLVVQEAKRELGQSALSATSADEVRRTRVEDLRNLFSV